jgi:single-stranded DNA-binding protein
MQYYKKGSKVVVTGRGNLRTYQGQDGQNKSSLELVVNDFTLPERQAQQTRSSTFNETDAF